MPTAPKGIRVIQVTFDYYRHHRPGLSGRTYRGWVAVDTGVVVVVAGGCWVAEVGTGIVDNIGVVVVLGVTVVEAAGLVVA